MNGCEPPFIEIEIISNIRVWDLINNHIMNRKGVNLVFSVQKTVVFWSFSLFLQNKKFYINLDSRYPLLAVSRHVHGRLPATCKRRTTYKKTGGGSYLFPGQEDEYLETANAWSDWRFPL